jgi:glycosyltransferase involved in cell wall biosynthesis
MDLGIPVVASSVGGVPAVVQDGINGFLVPPGDSGAIRERLLRLAGEPDLRRMFSRAGKDMVSSRYNISDWSRRIEGMYESLVNGKCRQVPA